MDVLTKVKKRFTKNGYNVKAYEKDFGWRLVGEQEGGWFSSAKRILIYLVAKVPADTKAFLGFVDDLEHFHREFGDDYDVTGGYFIVAGDYDEKEFKLLKRRANEDVRGLIRIESVKGEEPKAISRKEERTREELGEKPKGGSPELEQVLDDIRDYRPLRQYEKEKELEDSVVSWLAAKKHRVRTQEAYENARIDAVIGHVGIEIKLGPDEGEFDRLYGQIDKYLKHLNHIIVVIGRERSKESTERFKDRIRDRDWLGSRVFIVRV